MTPPRSSFARCSASCVAAVLGTAIGGMAGGCAPPDDKYWEVEIPKHYTFDNDRPPHVEVPDTVEAQDAVPVPFEQVGEDDKGAGIVYTGLVAGYYLMRIQDADIGFHYQYDPDAGEFEESDNLHRKLGATFTQIWLYRFTGRPEFRMSTRAAIEYMLTRTEPQDDGTLLLRDLGATALVTLSLTEYAKLVETDEYDDEIDALGEYLLARVDDDGSFTEGKSLQWAQAHQALWRLYAYTYDERYLDALDDVARYFYDHRGDGDILGAPYLYGLWANEPLTNLYSIRQHDWLVDFVFQIGETVAEQQYTPVSDVDPDWVGGYWPNDGEGGPPVWDSTLKLEAVADAFRMAQIVDSAEHIDQFRKSAIIAVAFLQRLQWRRGETSKFDDPPFVVGGTPFDLEDATVRLDVPHHMTNAILKVVDYMDLEDYPGM